MHAALTTVPAVAAYTGLSRGPTMSTPACRVPQRSPKPEVTEPALGRIHDPAATGRPGQTPDTAPPGSAARTWAVGHSIAVSSRASGSQPAYAAPAAETCTAWAARVSGMVRQFDTSTSRA